MISSSVAMFRVYDGHWVWAVITGITLSSPGAVGVDGTDGVVGTIGTVGVTGSTGITGVEGFWMQVSLSIEGEVFPSQAKHFNPSLTI